MTEDMETMMIAETKTDQTILDRFARSADQLQERVEGARSLARMGSATHGALTRAAQMLSLVAHDLDEAAGGME